MVIYIEDESGNPIDLEEGAGFLEAEESTPEAAKVQIPFVTTGGMRW